MAATIDDMLNSVCEKFNIENVNDFQQKSIENLLLQRDVFLSVRTGGGKSLVYEAFQYICERREKEHCQVLIVTPLISIMKEQCDFLNSLGFCATYIGCNKKEDDEIFEGKHDFLFTSPESLLGVAKWRDMLLQNSRMRLIVVDEAHIVLHWGEVDGEQQSTPFREWFGKLGEVRSLVQCPLLLITATASKVSRLKVQKIFCMKNCFEIIESPDRTNIKLFLHKFKSSQDLTKIFAFLINELQEKKEKCDRYLIFCTSIKSCSEIYTMLHLELESDIKFVQMYHSMTVENVKEDIKQDLANRSGKIRVLVATSAAGMGVNFKDIGHVIIFGVPKNMDSFVQQFGRGGRDCSHAMAILLFNGQQCRGIDNDMSEYILNKETCRRQVILKAYNTTVIDSVLPHLCCDICDKNCTCEREDCKCYNHPFFEMCGKILPDLESSHSESDSDCEGGDV